jgi:steroid delta-isomerase-like uncharacterized protein
MRPKEDPMKKLLASVPLMVLLCCVWGCQDQAAVAELEALEAQELVEAQNIELAKKMVKMWVQDLDWWQEFMHPDFLYYFPSGTATPLSKEETMVAYGEAFFSAIPDFNTEIEEIYAIDDTVVFRFSQTGTPQAEVMGIPPSGNSFDVSGIVIARFKDGKIIEMKEEFDMLGFNQQLGMELKPKE